MAIAIGVGLLLQIPSMMAGIQSGASTAAENAIHRDARGDATRNARNVQKQSSAALERAKTGCQDVVDTATRHSVPFTEGTEVNFNFDPNRPLPPGIIICNGDGFTAETVEHQESDGRIITIATNVMKVSANDKPLYDCYRAAWLQGGTIQSCERIQEVVSQ